jgi:hypothetical protein
MAQVETSHRTTAIEHASHTRETIRSQGLRDHHVAVRAFRRLLAAIVNGSDHPCWGTDDATARFFLLSPREQNRLLDSGAVTRNREF